MRCLNPWQLFVIYFNQSHRELVNKPLKASLEKLEETAAIPLPGIIRKAKLGTGNLYIISFGDLAVLWKTERHVIKTLWAGNKSSPFEEVPFLLGFPCDSPVVACKTSTYQLMASKWQKHSFWVWLLQKKFGERIFRFWANYSWMYKHWHHSVLWVASTAEHLQLC